jgi:hypothetical protein
VETVKMVEMGIKSEPEPITGIIHAAKIVVREKHRAHLLF